MADAAGRGDVRLAGPRGARARRPRRGRLPRPSCSPTSPSSGSGGRSTSTPRSSPTRWSPSAPARSGRSRPRPTLLDIASARPAARARLRAAARRRRRRVVRDRRPSGSATSRRCCARHLPEGDPVRGYADALAGDPGLAGQQLRATSPARSTWCCGCEVDGTHPLRDRRLQDQLARRPGDAAADRRRLPPGGARRGDGPLRLPAAGAALRRGPAPLPALAAARLRPAEHLGGVLYLYLRGMCGPETPAGRRAPRAASSPGGPPSRSSRTCPTCSTECRTVTVTTLRARSTRTDARLALGADRPARRPSTRPACSPPPTCTSPPALGRLGGEPDARVLLAIALAARAVRGRLGLPRPGHDRRPARRRAAAVARAVRAGRARSPPARSSASGCCTGSTGCSTSTATTSRRRRSSTTSPPAPRPPRRTTRAAGRHRARPGLPGAGYDEQQAACRGAAGAVDDRASPAGPAPARRPRSRVCSSPCTSRPRRAGETAAHRHGGADRQGRGPAGGGGPRDSAARFGDADRARLDGLSAMTLHRLLRPLPRQQHPLPAPPRQPAAARRRRGRRVLDGVADDDGPAARGGAARRPAGAGGRPRPARLGRCGGGAHRPRRGARGSPDSPVAALRTTHRFGAEIGALAEALRGGRRRRRARGAARRPRARSSW